MCIQHKIRDETLAVLLVDKPAVVQRTESGGDLVIKLLSRTVVAELLIYPTQVVVDGRVQKLF